MEQRNNKKLFLEKLLLKIKEAVTGLLIFQLITFSSLLIGQNTYAVSLEEQKANCTGSSTYWDDELNSCMTKQEVVDQREQTKTCADSEDPEACYMEQAEKETGVKEGDKYQEKGSEKAAKIVAGAYSLFLLGAQLVAKRSGQGGSSCTSKWIFMLTSAAYIAGDFFLKHKAKNDFKDLAKQYEEEANNEDQLGGYDGSYQAQVRAFAYLKQEQEKIKEQAKQRQMLQWAVVAGFAGSLGMAIYESMNPVSACKQGENEEAGDQEAGSETADAGTEGAGTETAGAEGATETGAGEATAEAGGAEGATETVDAEQAASDAGFNFGSQILKTGTSPQIAVASGAMLALTGYLASHAGKEKKRAEENIKKIDEVMQAYSEHIAGYCPTGREDLNNERCYCYNADGSQNENRTNSVICQNLFASDNYNYSLLNPKEEAVASGPAQGCVTVTGQFDEDCRCKNMINTVSKQNACAKAPATTAINAGAAAQLGTPSTVANLGALTNGANNALAGFDSNGLSTQAAKTKKLALDMLKQANKDNKELPPYTAIEKMADTFAEKQGNILSRDPNYLARLSPGMNSRPAGLSAALEAAENKAKLEDSPAGKAEIGSSATSAGTGAIGATAKNGKYKFNWDAGGKNSGGSTVKTFMDKKYDYKDNDIVNRKGASIFNVISKRYQTSGLKRLFGDENDE